MESPSDDLFPGTRPAHPRMERSAVFSPCGLFRYELWRRWAPGSVLAMVLSNPSRAGAELDDPTARRGIGFARRFGFSGVALVNLSAYIATFPIDLERAGFPIGPDNDAHIEAVCRHPDVTAVALAYGRQHAPEMIARAAAVRSMLAAWGIQPKAIKINADGSPAHPARLAYSRALLEF